MLVEEAIELLKKYLKPDDEIITEEVKDETN